MRRAPDSIVGPLADPYLLRWSVVPKNGFLNVSIHKFLRSDYQILHDHPWHNLSVIVDGEYTEHTVNGATVYKAGQFRFRAAEIAHRIELHSGCCTTLFITGPKIRDWGYVGDREPGVHS